MPGNKFVRLLAAAVGAVILFYVVRGFLSAQQDAVERDATLEEIKQTLFVVEDHALALSRIAEALAVRPDDGWLYLYQGRAYAGRRRYGDALKAYENASTRLADDEEGAEEVRFLKGCAHAVRFYETGDREDLNLAERALEEFGAGGRFASAANVSLGIALSHPAAQGDPTRARRLIESGLDDIAIDPVIDVARAREVLQKLP